MKRHRLDARSEQRRLQGDTGELAEELAADAYGYNAFLTAPWFDAKREDTGAVIEVKSALSRLDSDEPGRFRLWREQHSRLVEEDREHTGRRMLRYVEVNPTRFSTFLADARVVDARVEVEHDGRVDLCPICAEVLSG